jgi:putative hydrolase of the HAD superfamily
MASAPKIKAVFFDLDGTLRQNLPRGGEVFATQAARLGVHMSDIDRLRAQRWEHYYWAYSKELLGDRLEFGGQVGDFWNRYSHRQLVALGASTAQAEVLAPQMNAYMAEAYKPESIVPDEVPTVLTSLRGSGLRLAVISNRDQPYEQEMEELGLAQFFSFSLAGGAINARKPEPEVFWHACQRLEVAPADSAYVGDNYFADVVGARAAGLIPVLYDPPEIFPDPGCASIRSFDELPGLIDSGGKAPHAAG